MRAWYLKTALILFCLYPRSGISADLSDVRVITSSFKPYSYSQDGEIRGVSVERVQKILSFLGIQPDIHVTSWKNAYETALIEPNMLIFSMLRTKEREQKFHWIGKIANVQVALFRKKEREDISLKSLEDGLKFTVGALANDAKGRYLAKNGYNLLPINTQNAGIKMVLSGRLDLIPADRNSLDYSLKEMGLPEDALVPAYDLNAVSKPVYLAFSKETPVSLVEKFRSAHRNAFPNLIR